MGLKLTEAYRSKLEEGILNPKLVVEINGIPHLLGTDVVQEKWRIGSGVIGDDDLTVGGVVESENSYDIIDKSSLKTTITQAIKPESGVSSVSSFTINLVDINEEVSQMLSPTEEYDVIGEEARVYSVLDGLSHPEDSILLFVGIVEGVDFGATSAAIKIAHPERLKQQALFVKAETKLASATTASDTLIIPEKIKGFLQPLDALECYVKIEDEIIKYDQIFNGNFTNCTRGALNTFATSHDQDTDIESFFVLKGNPFDLTLKLLMSTIDNDFQGYEQNVKVLKINQINAEDFRQNTLIFEEREFRKFNIQVGDNVKLSVIDPNAAIDYDVNNLITSTIENIDYNDNYAIVEVDKYLSTENRERFQASFRSKYQTLTEGCELHNKYIDIEEFERLANLHANEVVDCEIYIKDTIKNAKEFIDKIILYPQGLTSIPRKGKISIGKTAAPLADSNTKVLNKDNIIEANKLRISRSIQNNFFNSVIYKYHQDSLEDKFLRNELYQSNDSFKKIKIGVKPLVIEASSLRDSQDVSAFIDKQSKAFLDAFKYGAEMIKVKTSIKDGLDIEIPDTVICDFSGLSVTDIKAGSKDFQTRVMKVKNKALNISRNEVDLLLESTEFKSDGRYGVIAPSSLIAGGSTREILNLKSMFKSETDPEYLKWKNYVGEEILIRNDDWTIEEHVTLLGYDEITEQIRISPLSFDPQIDLIVDPPLYDETDDRKNPLFKALHPYINPSINVASGINDTSFTVADSSKLRVGQFVYIHNNDYSKDSPEVKISEINANTITVDNSLEFIPDSDCIIELIGFLDGGLPYRIA